MQKLEANVKVPPVDENSKYKEEDHLEDIDAALMTPQLHSEYSDEVEQYLD